MQKKNMQALSYESFAPFGTFQDMLHPDGYFLEGPGFRFYRDMLAAPNQTALPSAYSVLQVGKPKAYTVTGMEYHNFTPEVIMPMDTDVALCLIPANADQLDEQEAHVFRVPKGTMVVLRTAVWHAAPINLGEEPANVLIVLPERVYHNDLVARDFSEGIEVVI